VSDWSDVLSLCVSYRRAPKAVFPAAFDDCVAATKHFVRNAQQFSVNSRRVAVAG